MDEASSVGVMAGERMGEEGKRKEICHPPPTATVNTSQGNGNTLWSKWFSLAFGKGWVGCKKANKCLM